MALSIKDRVKETSTTTGTGTLTLAGAVTGFQAFSVIGDGNTTYYAITDSTDWEVGIGTYTLSGTTLSRDTVLESSNAGSLVNFPAGSKEVFVTYPAEKAISDGYGTLPVANGGSGATTLTGILKGNGTSAFTAVTAPTGIIVGTTDTQTLTNKTVTAVVLDGGFAEEVAAMPALDIDPANGSIQTKTLSSNSTFTESLSSGESVTLLIDDGSAYTITWPTIQWKTDGGAAPSLNTTGYTVIELWKVSTTLFGARVGDN